jgi:hypothetical protein
MSRSYRKNPIRKGNHDSHEAKRLSSRRFRRVSKVRVHKEEFEKLPLKKGEITDYWEIYDYRWSETLQEAIDTFESEQQSLMNGNERFRYWYKDKTREGVIATWKKTFYYK